MARLVLVLGLFLLASAGVVAEDNNVEGVMLRGSSGQGDRQVAPNQARECPPGRCPLITCIPEAQMVQKKCTTASNMCPTGFCAAVGNCTSCSRRSLFSEDNDRNSPFFGFQTPLPTFTADSPAPAVAAKSTGCPQDLCIRFTCVPAGGNIGYCGDNNPYCPEDQCPINGECVSCSH